MPRYRVANVVLPNEMDAMADGMTAGHRPADDAIKAHVRACRWGGSAAGGDPAQRVPHGDHAGLRVLELRQDTPQDVADRLLPRRLHGPGTARGAHRPPTASSIEAWRQKHTTSPLSVMRRPASASAASRLPGAERAYGAWSPACSGGMSAFMASCTTVPWERSGAANRLATTRPSGRTTRAASPSARRWRAAGSSSTAARRGPRGRPSRAGRARSPGALPRAGGRWPG